MTDAVQLLKALADETRLRILNLLSQRELCVCQIVEVLELSQSKTSRHLAHLRNAGLVQDRREGLWVYYSLAPPQGLLDKQIIQWFGQAKDEVPRSASDLRALADLGECGDLCTEGSPHNGEKQEDGAIASG